MAVAIGAMIVHIHVLVCSCFARELSVAYLAIKRRCPVIQRIHVLTSPVPCCEASVTGLAFVRHGSDGDTATEGSKVSQTKGR
jgi:hypothetical protein